MKTISGHIADGAMAFLKAEYRILTYFVIVVGILLGIMGFSNANSHWSIGIAFAVGAIFFGYSRLYRNENRYEIKCKNSRSC
jgi:K(+)-stimulated pyrophosphate-energized sodium pump